MFNTFKSKSKSVIHFVSSSGKFKNLIDKDLSSILNVADLIIAFCN